MHPSWSFRAFLIRIARLAAVLAVIAGGSHFALRFATQHRVEAGTLFELSRQRLALAPMPETPVILLIGDTGAASPELRANFDAMAREKALLVLHAGDIAYRGSRLYGRFLAAAEALPFPMFVVPGDHDRDPVHGYAAWDDLFGGRDRVVDKNGLRIVLLDSSQDSLSAESFRFLATALQAPPPPQPAPRWIVVLTHCPPYKPNAGRPTPLGEGHVLRDAAIAAQLLEHLRNARVTLLCAGHLHSFARGNVAGVPLVVSGGGGKDVEPGEEFHYVRITLSDPPTIEPVVTSPASGREPLARLVDGVVAESLDTGDLTAAVLAAAAAVLFAVARFGRKAG